MKPSAGGGAGLLMGLLTLSLAGCSEPAPPIEAAPRPIAWAEVRPAERAARRSLSGVVRTVQRAPLSFEVPGRIATLDVEVGERFESGEILARLDPRSYELARQERLSEVAEAEASLREAEQAFARQRELHERDLASTAAFDAAEAALETARARLAMARARGDIANEDLADTWLRAPYPGIVARRFAEPAQRVAPGETVLEIQGNGSGLEIAVAVPETLIDKVQAGAVHPVGFPACGDASSRARVAEIGTDAEPSGAFAVTLRLAQAPCELRAGMTAEVAFAVPDRRPASGRGDAEEEGPAVTIPVTAFLAGDGPQQLAFVFTPEDVVGAVGVLEARSIALGPVDSERAIVLAGLRPGEIIATRGLPFLRAGQRVARLGVGPARFE